MWCNCLGFLGFLDQGKWHTSETPFTQLGSSVTQTSTADGCLQDMSLLVLMHQKSPKLLKQHGATPGLLLQVRDKPRVVQAAGAPSPEVVLVCDLLAPRAVKEATSWILLVGNQPDVRAPNFETRSFVGNGAQCPQLKAFQAFSLQVSNKAALHC